MERVRILFLAANPVAATRLALDEEAREIEHKLHATAQHSAFEFITKWAVQPDDLLQALNQYRPHVVHFSGHGSEHAELVLAGADGNARRVSQQATVDLFRTLRDNIRVVVLNACYSRIQAEGIAKHIDCVVGMRRAIGDRAAIRFAASFYRALAFGRSVQNAFEQGLVSLDLEGIGEGDTPVLIVRRRGVDPACIILARNQDAAKAALYRDAQAASPGALGVPVEMMSDVGSWAVQELFKLFDADLQDAFSLAYNATRRDGSNRISTRRLFAAILRLRPDLASLLPTGSLPAPLDEGVRAAPPPLTFRPDLSSCVADSIAHLSVARPPARNIGPLDMFVDIVRYGTGPSVVRLRAHGIGRAEIDELVGRRGWHIIGRKT
jgi:hypothetical protein